MELDHGYVIDIYSKYAWIVSLKDKGGITVKNSLLKVLDESGCKPDKAQADHGSEFYNRSMTPWLRDNVIEIYSTRN